MIVDMAEKFVTVRITSASRRRLGKVFEQVLKAGGWRGVGLVRDVPLNLGTLMDEAIDALEARVKGAR